MVDFFVDMLVSEFGLPFSSEKNLVVGRGVLPPKKGLGFGHEEVAALFGGVLCFFLIWGERWRYKQEWWFEIFFGFLPRFVAR